MSEFYYSTGDHKSRIEVFVSDNWCFDRPREQRQLAEICAKKDWNENGQWVAGSAKEIKLYKTTTSSAFATLIVEYELEPDFIANHTTEPEPEPFRAYRYPIMDGQI